LADFQPDHTMNKLLLVLMSSLALAAAGCHHHAPKQKAPATTTTTEFTPDREQKVKDKVEELTKKGVTPDEAQRLARQQIPLTQTTTTQNTNVQKEKQAQEKFEKDLAKSLKPK
jgi:hypothetical protein